MQKTRTRSPLLGYNTNVRHAGRLFHIQTEDSGVGRPHIITHLFVKGTILATKKTSYNHLLEEEDLETGVRNLMKDQHRAMFIELRDGVHDATATQRLGSSEEGTSVQTPPPVPPKIPSKAAPKTAPKTPPKTAPKTPSKAPPKTAPKTPSKTPPKRPVRPTRSPARPSAAAKERVRVVQPTAPKDPPKDPETLHVDYAGRSIFDTPKENGDSVEERITDKSLDEVILSYLTEEGDE
ncbi:MAG: hypothetical protein QNJ97_00165 [Myxococcota bacterium]|nr:hypothetical protein [Myxococcota bacterium]